MSAYDEEMIKQLIKGLMQEIIQVKSKFKLWQHIQQQRNEYIDELNLAPAFFTLILQSMFNDVIITTAKLYEHGKGTINLNKLINIAENHKEIFIYEEKNKSLLNNEVIKEHKVCIETKKEQLDNLFTWRDRVYAHNDKKYFFEKNQVIKDAELTIENLEDLLQNAWEIVNFYSLALEGNAWYPESIDTLDVDCILSILKNFNEQKKMKLIY
ncbi:AbiU2 domain-containing protein [Niallia endozanthoxylica]|uniref:HEPN AbiU2-like domain-containing protein n=1 Tax=Niallia endozanthoxylica TaxID=2036016 RepID=A0A5J5HRV4_9BACI|nr:hypothetical protein [Niallia endozanthoxylica]KAA9023562.1 hypothetical protein F4V44_12915 [Niallia endozanthoxylica]